MKIRKKIEMLDFDFGGDLFIDIGGNVGMWTKELHSVYNKVIFVEPSFNAMSMAKSQINADNVIFLQNACLSENNKLISLYSPSIDSGQFTIYGEELYENIMMREEGVKSITLDSLSKYANDNDEILIKIDTEGADLDVIDGGFEFIQNYRPTIFMETHFHMHFDNQQYQNIMQKLKDLNYNIEEFKNTDYLIPATANRVLTKNLTGRDIYDMHYQILMSPR